MNDNRLTPARIVLLTPVPEPLVQRLGAIVLSHCERAGRPGRLGRVVVYSQRLIVYHLAVSYREAFGLELDVVLGIRIGRQVYLMGDAHGSVLIVDLQAEFSPRRSP